MFTRVAIVIVAATALASCGKSSSPASPSMTNPGDTNPPPPPASYSSTAAPMTCGVASVQAADEQYHCPAVDKR
jgi:hypothetical protein